MREVIEEILGTEKQAQRTVEDARKRAAEIRAHADAESADILARARADAQLLMREQGDAARERARAKHQAAVGQATEENRIFLQQQEAGLEQLVDRVVRIILRPEQSDR